MKLAKLWMVVDPSPKDGLADFVWEQDAAKLEHQMRGGENGWWKKGHGAVYTTRAGALDDAQVRMQTLSTKPHRSPTFAEDYAYMFSVANVRRVFGSRT